MDLQPFLTAFHRRGRKGACRALPTENPSLAELLRSLFGLDTQPPDTRGRGTLPSSDESIITAEAALASQSKFLPLVPHPCKRARDALTYKLPQLELSHVSKKTFYHRHQEWIGWALSPNFTGLRSVSMFCCTADECCQLMRRPLLSARRSDPD